jgi:hypothetical protein
MTQPRPRNLHPGAPPRKAPRRSGFAAAGVRRVGTRQDRWPAAEARRRAVDAEERLAGALWPRHQAANLSGAVSLPTRTLPHWRAAPSHLAIALAAVMLTASGCGAGAGNEPTTELLRSANPLTADIYVQIRGPSGAVHEIADAFETGAFAHETKAFTKAGVGFFVPPRLHHRLHQQRICLFTQTIRPWHSPTLQPWVGKKVTIWVYGNKSSARLFYCRLFSTVFLGAH